MAALCGSLLSANAGIIFTGSTATNTGKNITDDYTIETDMADWHAYSNANLSATFSKLGGSGEIGELTFNADGSGESGQGFKWTGSTQAIWTPADETSGSTAPAKTGLLNSVNATRNGDSFELTITANTAADYRLTVYGGAKQIDIDFIATAGATSITNSDWISNQGTSAESGIWTLDFTAENINDIFDVRLLGLNSGTEAKLGIGAVTLEVIPEPATLGMMMVACGGLFLARRKKIKH